MPYNPNDLNYNTKQSRIASFDDFVSNKKEELDELEKIDRSFLKNDNDEYNLPNLKKLKYNKVTNKLDDLSKEEVKDNIKSISSKKKKHKYKAIIPSQQKN